MYQVYNPYFTQINNLNETKSRKLCTQLMDWIDTLPVYGFNSSSYDINVVKKYLPHILIKNSKRNGNISKKEKQWLQTIENQLQRNLEHNRKIERYNVDGYDRVTNTVYEFNGCFFHGCQTTHRVTQNVDQYLKEHTDLKFDKNNIIELLKKSSIPEKKWFYNDLTRSNLSDCNYSKIKSNYDNLFELLKDYNNADVRPAVEATKKL